MLIEGPFLLLCHTDLPLGFAAMAARWSQCPAEIKEIAEIVASLLCAACAEGTFLYFFCPAEINEIAEILLRLADSEGVLSFISFISAGLKNLCDF